MRRGAQRPKIIRHVRVRASKASDHPDKSGVALRTHPAQADSPRCARTYPRS